MRGLKSDLARALYLAEKADVGKEGERVKSFPHLTVFPSILFSCMNSRCKGCILPALISGAWHTSQTKPLEHQHIENTCMKLGFCFSCNKPACKAFI